MDQLAQERSRFGPFPLDGAGRSAVQLGHLVDGQACEVTKLDESMNIRGDALQHFERCIHRQQLLVVEGLAFDSGCQSDHPLFAAALERSACAHVVDHDVAHDSSNHSRQSVGLAVSQPTFLPSLNPLTGTHGS